MPNACAAYGCISGYKIDNIKSFHFPLSKKKSHLLEKWLRFINREDFTPSDSSVICIKHFDDKFINHGERKTLKWKLSPIPTIHSEEVLKNPSTIPTPQSSRKLPKKRAYQEDEMEKFKKIDKINHFDDINKENGPGNFQFKKNENCIIFFHLKYDDDTGFPKIFESIRIDRSMHIQMQYNGNPVPLPAFFVTGTDAKLKSFSSLTNLFTYISSFSETCKHSFIDELNERRNKKPKGRGPYSAELIRYALLLRYTSLAAYKLLLEQFPLPSISLLNKIQAGGVSAIKGAKHLMSEGKISKDVVLIFDEMYLEKQDQYTSEGFVGSDENGDFYKGVVVFMICGLKENVPYVIKSCPEISINGTWLAKEICESITALKASGFNVRGAVCDNHSTNVKAFSILVSQFKSESEHFIMHSDAPDEEKNKIYLMFDNVHLLQNIRNNLFKRKKFSFPEFPQTTLCDHEIKCPPGYVSYSDIHAIYDQDCEKKPRLAPKLSYRSMHPGNDKQNVNLALALFHDQTIAAILTYRNDRKDMAGFLDLIRTWWTIMNANSRFNSEKLAHAFIPNDGKLEFLRKFANWVEEWCKSPCLCLTAQTSDALVRTLRAQASLIEDLHSEGYDFVIPRKLQSDPLERRFSQYRQMSGGRFLVSLREVNCSERILQCRSLLKCDVDFWKEDLQKDVDSTSLASKFVKDISEFENPSQEVTLNEQAEEASFHVAGYVARKLKKRCSCNLCKNFMVCHDTSVYETHAYSKDLSRGNLTIPSVTLAEFVSCCFALLDLYDVHITKFKSLKIQIAAKIIIEKYAIPVGFTCGNESCLNWGQKFATKIITNIFYNCKQKSRNDLVRKNEVKDFKVRQRNKNK